MLPIMVSVLADVPRMPFSLTRLIAEAKQRARQRRLLLAIAVAVVLAVTVVAAEAVTRSPAAAVSRSSASGCARNAGAAATPAASADARFALVRRDEVRMLCLVLPPPGAQLLTREPPPMAQEAQRFFGFPKPFAPFARHRFWRVHSSVAAVVSFEKADPPAGLVGGCSPKGPADCGVGVLAGTERSDQREPAVHLAPNPRPCRIARVTHDHPRTAAWLDGDPCRCRQSSPDPRVGNTHRGAVLSPGPVFRNDP